MKLSVFGLGYVGCVTAGCFAKLGHEVIGVDVNPLKVQSISRGDSPIIEDDIGDIISTAVRSNKLTATHSAEEAVLNSDISLICVGTPSNGNGSLNLKAVEACGQDIGQALHRKSGYHIVALRSTVMPGSTRSMLAPILELKSQKKIGRDFGICANPEFLREGTSVNDFRNPSFTLIGSADKTVRDLMAELYSHVSAPLIETEIEIAEIVKYVSNAFHALKVCFANEIGNICKAVGIDSHEVMRIFCQDKKLNLSASYLKPGFAFGGSCLPKDLRALTYLAKSKDVYTPLINAILPSNDQQLNTVKNVITALGKKRIGIYGLSFKAGTDDLRESPMVLLTEYLLGRGYEVRIFDRNVSLSALHGANRDFIEREIPHIRCILTDSFERFSRFSEIIVVGHPPQEDDLSKMEGKIIVDLLRMPTIPEFAVYHGLSW